MQLLLALPNLKLCSLPSGIVLAHSSEPNGPGGHDAYKGWQHLSRIPVEISTIKWVHPRAL